jgi:histone-binding protein RBBP4
LAAPFLYDLVLSHALEWPSLTVEWLPDVRVLDAKKEYQTQRCVLGTHTSESEQNFLLLADVKMPSESAAFDPSKYASDEAGAVGMPSAAKVEVAVKIPHEGEVDFFFFF